MDAHGFCKLVILLILILFQNDLVLSGRFKPCIIKGTAPFFNVICRHLHFQSLPSDLPSDMYYFKVSNNRNLRIPKNFFKNRRVTIFLASNCGLNYSFTLPENLQDLDLHGNALSTDHLKEMFIRHQPHLLTFDISHNKVNIGEFLKDFKNSPHLVTLKASTNVWPYMTRENMENLKGLHTLEASNVSMTTINDGALTGMKKLGRLILNDNKIKTLPDKLFKDCNKLVIINFDNNSLAYLPQLQGLPEVIEVLNFGRNRIKFLDNLTESGIKSVNHFNFHGNRIKYIPKDLFKRLLVTLNLDLSKNQIMSLDAYAFGNIKRITFLLLQQNNITKISRDAFQGIKFIDLGLFLFMNKMTVLPEGLFRGMTINKIFLHSNQIGLVNSSFAGSTVTPRVLVVYDNQLKEIVPSLVNGITPETQFYISCNQLENINLTTLRGIKLRCSPQMPYEVAPVDKSIAITLRDGGFFCSRPKKHKSFICKPCPTGEYNDGDYFCTKCPRGGYYQNNVGQSGCKICPVGQFVNHTGGNSALACNTCPIGSNTTRYATTRACFCLAGFARRDRFDQCERCKTYGGVTCQRDFEELVSGHWWMFQTEDRKRRYVCFTDGLLKYDLSYNFSCTQYFEDKPKAYKCPVKEACLGGVRGDCSQNYTGVLCDVCAKHYYRHLKMCVGCPGRAWAITQMIIVLIIFILLCLLIEWADRKTASGSKGRTLADVILSSLKIVVAFYQTLSVTQILLSDIPWPKSLVYVSHYFRYLEMRVLSVRSLRCIFPSLRLTLIHELLISLGATIGLPLALLIILRLFMCFIPRRSINYEKRANQMKKVVYRYIAIFLFYTFPMTSRRVFQMLPMGCTTLCYDRETTKCVDFIRADLRLKCASSDPSNWLYVYLAYAGLIIPIGFPLLMLLLVKIYKKYPPVEIRMNSIVQGRNADGFEYHLMDDDNLNDTTDEEPDDDHEHLHLDDRDQHIEDHEEVVNTDTPIEFAIKFLYENYKRSSWYWELIEMLRKLSLNLALAVFGVDTRTNLGMFITLSGFFAILYSYNKPIKDKNEHVLQMISLTVTFLNSCAGLLLKVSPRDNVSYDDRRDNQGISLILVFLNGFVILVVLVRVIKGLGGSCLRCIREKKCSWSRVKETLKVFLVCKDVHHH